MGIRRQFATLIRRFPFLMRFPYYGYRFLRPKYSVGVVGIVFNDVQEVLLVEHVFHPRDAWGLPGGWVDHNENPKDAVVRELAEELNLTVQSTALVALQRTAYNHLDVAYLCDVNGDVGKVSFELLGYDWFAMDALPTLKAFHHDVIVRGYARLSE